MRLHQLQLAAVMVLLHFAVESHQLTGFETVAQIGGVKPCALQPDSALAGSHLKNRHAAGAEQT